MNTHIDINRKHALWLMLAVLLLASALRMIALETTPPGFYVDEAIESYDAYALWHTGRDHHGTRFPITPGGVNDYRMPLFIYLLAPLVGTAGLTVTTARLGAAFCSILGVAGIYALGSRMVNRVVGVTAALFLAISPWHVPFGRFTHEGSAAVLITVLAIGMLWQWRTRQRRGWLIGAAVMSALGIYTYSTMKLFLPLMLLSIAVFWWRTLWSRWRQVLSAAAIGLLLVTPMLYVHIRDSDKMQARYRAVAVFQPERPFGEALVEALQNTWNNLSPDFLFGRGDHDALYHPQGTGQLYLAQAALIALGVVWGLRRRQTRTATLLLGMWTLLSVLPAALTIHCPGSGSGNASRALTAVVSWQLLSGLGVAAVLSTISSRRLLWGIGLALSLWVGYDAGQFFVYYFGDYATDAYYHFDGQMQAIMTQVAPVAAEYDTIYLTCLANDFPYTQILFYTRYDPNLLQSDLPDRGDWLFAPVWRVGKYNIVCDTTDLWNQELPGLYIVPEDELPEVTPLALIPTLPGQSGYKLIARQTFAYDFAALEWLGQCTQPVTPLSPALLDDIPITRNLEFDCTSTWVYPSGTGAYVLHAQLLSGDAATALQDRALRDPFTQRHIDDAQIGFSMPKSTRDFPAFVMYEASSGPPLPETIHGVISPAAIVPPITAIAPLSPRIDLQGPLTFVGLALYTDEMGTEVESWWEVTATPITRPLSLMAHWLTAEGEALAIADGLGVAPSLLQSGDTIVQRHRFANLWPAPNHWLRIGAYWLDTMERWPVAGAGEADAIFIRVERPSTP
ncbi:MAG: glycosyltransferase family 39 protein [Anaerolineae bacterium]